MFSCFSAQCCYQSGNSRTLIVLVSWPCSSGRNHSDFLPQAQPRMSRAFLSLLCSCHPISSEMPTSTPSTSKAHSPFTSLLLLLRKTTLKPQSVSKPLQTSNALNSPFVLVCLSSNTLGEAEFCFCHGLWGSLGQAHFSLFWILLSTAVSQRISIQVWKWKQGWGSYWHWFLKCLYVLHVPSTFPHFTHSCSSPSHKMSLTHEFSFCFVKLVTFWHFTFLYFMTASKEVISVN